MASHNNQDNQDLVSSSGPFRNVFFSEAPKRSTTNPHEDATNIKRARLDSSTIPPSAHEGTTPEEQQEAMECAIDTALEELKPEHHHHHHRRSVHQVVVDAISHQQLPEQLFQHTSEHSDFVSTPTCSTPVNEGLAPQQVHAMGTEENERQIMGSKEISDEQQVQIQAPKTSTDLSTSVTASSSARVSPATKVPSCGKHSIKKRSACRVKKHRSRSLPNIVFSSLKHSSSLISSVAKCAPPPLPPVNIQSLREIDLAEILKNPQLRHDILFDPQLQFRPNLDGERGRRKKITYDKYWAGVRDEIESYYISKLPFVESASRLPNLFTTLKDILVSLLPSRDKPAVQEILDIDLILQQLSQHSLDLIGLASWLSTIFKSHCAPMRDSWVDEMMTLFYEADAESSVMKLVEGLRLIFTILEAMKLDVANHQIRMLRPVLVQTAVNFEKDYFAQMISRCKLEITDSLNWFKRCYDNMSPQPQTPRDAIVPSVLSLLSCSNMVSEFPSSLAFDHARLIVLRANVRQVVCLQLCLVLYKQLVAQSTSNSNTDKAKLISEANLEVLRKEVLAIITDDNGNVKWTRNIGAIALQLVRRSSPNSTIDPKDLRIDFAFNWLIKQTQPSSSVYSLMEQRFFKTISQQISLDSEDLTIKAGATNVVSTGAATPTPTTPPQRKSEDHDDISGIAARISLLTKFHWSVFGSYYTDVVTPMAFSSKENTF